MRSAFHALLWSCLSLQVLAKDILKSTGYQLCQEGGDLSVRTLAAEYDKDTRSLSFDIAGSSNKRQNVTALLTVTAYGQEVYSRSFNPCDSGIAQLCPVPATNFSAHGNQTIPAEYADKIPSIAFSIPDLDGSVKLQIMRDGTNQSVACIQASVTNGKTVNLPSVQYVGYTVAGVALVSTGAAALLSAGQVGAPASMSPSFGEMIGWFQAMAMNGMLSVDYPPVYKSFTSNFGFSTGLISWPGLQQTIDRMRGATGGNLTTNSYNYLESAKLNSSAAATKARRSLLSILARDGTSISLTDPTSGTQTNSTGGGSGGDNSEVLNGIQAYSEQLMVPRANTFVTLLLIFAIVVAGVILLILLFKIILEIWSMARPLPKSLESWRKRYWWRMAKAITGLVVILYGVWTMYCIYQFTNGDSWLAKLLAGLTLGLFTLLLGGFIIRIVYKARQFKKEHGNVDMLYEDKETWVTYSLFYDSFKRTYWWIFIVLIIGACARGAIIAGANGHGLVQTIGHLSIDVVLLVLLLWSRPYQNKSGNVINIIIQVVRVLSVACILVFVEQFGISQTSKTIAGLALIVTQAVLTGLLAILLAVNAIIFCIRENPERRKRKQAEKHRHISDDLTPLNIPDPQQDVRDVPSPQSKWKVPVFSPTFGDQRGAYNRLSDGDTPSAPAVQHSRGFSDSSYCGPNRGHEQLPPYNAAPTNCEPYTHRQFEMRRVSTTPHPGMYHNH